MTAHQDCWLMAINMRERILKALLSNVPGGDLWEWQEFSSYKISCLFVFFKRIDLMTNILHCLASQEFNLDLLEVIMVEDRGGTEEGKKLAQEFKNLNVAYFAPHKNWGKMGYMRNYSLSKARGEIVLFLDDDTTILDKLFLKKLDALFENDRQLMAVVPKGNASYTLLKNRYGYHDPYFFSNRCVAYRRECLIRLKGFDNTFVGQEDVELAIRFLANGYKFLKSRDLEYYHPPLVVEKLNKPKAVGFSFARSKYSPLFKSLLALNGSRWLPLFAIPTQQNIEKARFAFGFLLGFLEGLRRRGKEVVYV